MCCFISQALGFAVCECMKKMVSQMSDFYPMHAKYFISTNLGNIVDNVNDFRKHVYPDHVIEENPGYPDFPSVCIVGLGRCGSNVSLKQRMPI
jgi:hypothetical protein